MPEQATGFDCAKVRDRCQAMCCGPCPIPKATWESRQADVQGKVKLALEDDEGFVHTMTEDGSCPFRTDTATCAIYPKPGEPDGRSEVCRRMGDESHLMLTCVWMDRDGRLRPRPERRDITRRMAKEQHRIISNLRREVRKNHA